MDKLIVGYGYLGTRVAKRWRDDGHRVHVTTRSVEKASVLRNDGFEPVVCDVLDMDSLSRLPRVETVLYCVGFDRNSGQTMRDVYVRGLSNVLEQLPHPDRFLHVSSTSVYGQKTGEFVDEHSQTEPEEENGRIVLDAEKALHQKLPEAIILRFAGIYGPGRLLRKKAIVGGEEIRADPERWLNLIHVEDGAAVVVAAEKNGQPGRIYNVADDRPAHRREFYSALAHLLRAPEPRFVPLDPNAPPPPHEKANRRIATQRIHDELNVTLVYPTFEQGLAGSLEG